VPAVDVRRHDLLALVDVDGRDARVGVGGHRAPLKAQRLYVELELSFEQRIFIPMCVTNKKCSLSKKINFELNWKSNAC
jgi:hypothetical protein